MLVRSGIEVEDKHPLSEASLIHRCGKPLGLVAGADEIGDNRSIRFSPNHDLLSKLEGNTSETQLQITFAPCSVNSVFFADDFWIVPLCKYKTVVNEIIRRLAVKAQKSVFAQQLLQLQAQGETVADSALLMGTIGGIVLEGPALIRKAGRGFRVRSFWSDQCHLRLQFLESEFGCCCGIV